jgi:hypothetical protein
MNAATIRGDKGQLRLEIIGRENPRAQDLDDSNWLRASLEVKGGPFSGTIEFGITAAEIDGLYNELKSKISTLNGSIHFVTMEEDWVLDVVFERTGTVVVSGRVTTKRAQANSLHYEYRTDPITLESVVEDLRCITKSYPAYRAL